MKKIVLPLSILLLFWLAACGGTADETETKPFIISAIPDQDPELLQREYGKLADYLSEQLGVPVEYRPVTDYAASVTAFRVGDLDMVWFGGLTGVQARLQVEGSQALVQRTIDEQFTSVFIANSASGIPVVNSVEALSVLADHTFTFGSESSTSGRLMPQYFLSQAGVTLNDFTAEPGFSGAHDKTIELVEAGSFEAGVLNSQVWKSRVESGDVDLDKVMVILETPTYHDYHWVIRPDAAERYGDDFAQRVTDAFLNLDPNNPDHAEILSFFGAEGFIATQNSNYDQIEAVGRDIGQIVDN